MAARIDVSIEHKNASPEARADGKPHPNTCPGCGSHYRDDELEQHLNVCPQCSHHFPMPARARITLLADEGSFAEEAADLRSDDPLGFFDLRPYTERLAEAEVATGLGDAMVIGQATLDGSPLELAVMDFSFMGGSMGRVVGEKFTRACESAADRQVPLVSLTASGGARMQEGIPSLMQLPQTVSGAEAQPGGRRHRPRSLPLLRGARLSGELERLQRQLERIAAEPSDEEIWRSVELARNPERPYTLDYVERMLEDFVELHGDRGRADDAALVTGLGRFDGRTVALIGHQKGRNIQERSKRNFGMAYPEGYRKAMRIMELADRHGFPLITLVDTPGAYPGVAAEQHGQGGMIARSQAVMARLRSPIVSCIIGEGGSGGAIAIAVADRVPMQEDAIYSVISPEGCAAILWRDAGEAQKAAAAFKPDAVHCLELGVIDAIVPEPADGAHTDADAEIGRAH